MTDIFLSYSKSDAERIGPLVEALESRDWQVFWDRRIPAGQTWHAYIEDQINAARCVVVAWTANSIKSRWVLEEAEMGMSANRLVPVLLEPVSPPIGYRGIQAADLTRWSPGRPDEAFDQFVTDLAGLLADNGQPATDIDEDTALDTLLDSGEAKAAAVRSSYDSGARDPDRRATADIRSGNGAAPSPRIVPVIARRLQLTLAVLIVALAAFAGYFFGGAQSDRQATMQEMAPSESGANRREEIDLVWRASVYTACQNMLVGRFPFEAGSARDVSLVDFTRLFAYGGIIDGFERSYLASAADTLAIPADGKAEGGLQITRRAARMFELARDIRRLFFAGGRKQPVIAFQLRPMNMDSEVMRAVLQVDDERLVYQHGPGISKTFGWPNDKSQQPGASIGFERVDGRVSQRRFDGEWSLMKLLEFASFSDDPGRQNRLAFELDGLSIDYELIPRSALFAPLFAGLVINGGLGEFECVQHLF